MYFNCFCRGLLANEICDLLETDDEKTLGYDFDVCIIPNERANNDLTDEDSGEENEAKLDNLPPVLLGGQASIEKPIRYGFKL